MFPQHFTQTILELYGSNGAAWLESLPERIAACERRWSLTALPPFNLSYNYVAPAVGKDGAALVLKLGVPNLELLTEMAALKIYDGRGCARLFECDPEQGILLMERVLPGRPLAELADDKQITQVIAQTMQKLWRPLPAEHPFHPLERWTGGLKRLRETFVGGTGPFPNHLVECAEGLFADLLASSPEPVLLHGDLHQWNILSAQVGADLCVCSYKALDPKGLAGDPLFDTGVFFYNPPPDLFSLQHPESVYERRTRQTAEVLGADPQRILAWGFAECVLSAWWSYEDHGHGWEETLALAEIVLKVKL